MNLTCSTCQNPLSCSNCQVNQTSLNQPSNFNNNNNSSSSSSSSITELSGILKKNLGNRQTKNGQEFFFGTLSLDDGTEQVFFFFDPDYDLLTRLNILNEGNRIKVSGYVNKTGRFVAKKLIEDDGAEVF